MKLQTLKITFLSSLIFFTIILSNFVFGQHAPFKGSLELDAPMPVDPKIRTGKLDNGLKYYIRYNKKPEKRAELRLVVKTGSIMEDDDQQGLAHFCEHMAFNGTKNFKKSEIVDYLETVGVNFGHGLNAYTSFDETVYKIQIPTDSAEIVEKGFQILEDWAHNITFEDEEVDKERGVIIEEWRLGRGAGARMRDKYFPVLFKGSRYAERLPIGKKNILETFDYETLKRFYKDWYRPDLMAVIVVGDFEVDDMEEKVIHHFSKLEKQTNPRARTVYPVPDHNETLIAIESDKEASSTSVSVYYKHDIKEEKTVADYRRIIVNRLYSNMINERLNELLHQPEPPFFFGYSYYGGLVRTKDSYTSYAQVKENGIKKGLETLLTENERVRQFGFTKTELERQKKEMLRYMEKAVKELEKTRSVAYASEYIRNFLTDEPIPGIEFEYEIYKKYIPTIELSEINKLSGEWITDKNNVIIITAPENETNIIPTKQEIRDIFKSVSMKKMTAYKDKVSGKPLLEKEPAPSKIEKEVIMEKLGVTEITLANNIRIVLKPTDFKNDEILFRAFSPGGHSIYPDSLFLSASYASSIINKSGIGSFSEIELGKALTGKIVSVYPWIGELGEGMGGNASPQDLETLFQLVYLYFNQPRKDSIAYLAFKSSQKGKLENRDANPQSVFRDSIKVIMSQNHVRRKVMTKEMVDLINLRQAMSIYKDRFGDASDFTFFFVGSFETEKIKPLIVKYLGGLPAINRNETWKDINVTPPKGVISKTIYRGIEPKSRVHLEFTGDFEWNYKNRFDMNAMLKTLRIKLRESMREDKGGVYGVGTYGGPSKYPDTKYRIVISFGCAPENVEDLIHTAFAEIEALQKNGAVAEDLVKVKEGLKRSRETSLKENGFWIGQLQSYYYYNENPVNILNYDKYVEELTAKDIQKAATDYFDMENYVRVVLMPESEKSD